MTVVHVVVHLNLIQLDIIISPTLGILLKDLEALGY